MCPIGVSSTGNAGHMPLNISRATAPCSAATPLRTRREAHAHHRHVELAIGFVGALAERVELVERHADRVRELGEVRLEQIPREPVDPSRDRRVRGEHAAGADGLDGLVEREAAVGPFADALESEEAGVALVHVEHLWVQCRVHATRAPRRCRA